MSTLELVSPPVRNFQIAEFGCAFAPVEFENSSDQTNVPEGILKLNTELATGLTESPGACATAWTMDSIPPAPVTNVQAQGLSSEVQRLQSEKHEAVADVTISRMMDEINSVAAGISSSGADEKLAQLRQRRAEAKGRAQAASVIAGTDANLQRDKLRAAAQKHVQNSEFVKGLGLAQPVQAAAPAAKASAVLPEGGPTASN